MQGYFYGSKKKELLLRMGGVQNTPAADVNVRSRTLDQIPDSHKYLPLISVGVLTCGEVTYILRA